MLWELELTVLDKEYATTSAQQRMKMFRDQVTDANQWTSMKTLQNNESQ